MGKPDQHIKTDEGRSADLSHSHEKHTLWVVYLTAVTMVVEIIAIYCTNSMALLADGYHMATHDFAFGLAWLAYFS